MASPPPLLVARPLKKKLLFFCGFPNFHEKLGNTGPARQNPDPNPQPCLKFCTRFRYLATEMVINNVLEGQIVITLSVVDPQSQGRTFRQEPLSYDDDSLYISLSLFPIF